MKALYSKFTRTDGSKLYFPAVKGAHRRISFKRASEAQDHSLKVRARYERLKQAAKAVTVTDAPEVAA